MEFSVSERLMLLSLLPKEGDYASLRMAVRLRAIIAFTEEEGKELKFRNEDGTIRWTPVVGPKQIDLSDDDVRFLRSRLQILNDAQKLTEPHLPLCDKFFE